MTPEPITVAANTPVERAARMMSDHEISGLPVVDESNILIGLVTEFDVLSKPGQLVSEIMTKSVVTISETTDPETIARLLVEQKFRRIPVVREGQIIGIISRTDLIKLFAYTRWSCESCGFFTRGFERLAVCPKCGSNVIILEREPPGM